MSKNVLPKKKTDTTAPSRKALFFIALPRGNMCKL
jgi:hypothetical protein